MAEKEDETPGSGETPIYQIRLEGHLGPQWLDWFGGLALTQAAGGDTLLTCPVVDQAALYGLLKKVRDLGMVLVSVRRIDPGVEDASIDE